MGFWDDETEGPTDSTSVSTDGTSVSPQPPIIVDVYDALPTTSRGGSITLLENDGTEHVIDFEKRGTARIISKWLSINLTILRYLFGVPLFLGGLGAIAFSAFLLNGFLARFGWSWNGSNGATGFDWNFFFSFSIPFGAPLLIAGLMLCLGWKRIWRGLRRISFINRIQYRFVKDIQGDALRGASKSARAGTWTFKKGEYNCSADLFANYYYNHPELLADNYFRGTAGITDEYITKVNARFYTLPKPTSEEINAQVRVAAEKRPATKTQNAIGIVFFVFLFLSIVIPAATFILHSRENYDTVTTTGPAADETTYLESAPNKIRGWDERLSWDEKTLSLTILPGGRIDHMFPFGGAGSNECGINMVADGFRNTEYIHLGLTQIMCDKINLAPTIELAVIDPGNPHAGHCFRLLEHPDFWDCTFNGLAQDFPDSSTMRN